MLKEFLKECLDVAKEEYFNTDHHHHIDEDSEWKDMLKRMDRDFFDEWISPVIDKKDNDLWYACDKFMLYMLTKDVIEEM
jgi:hypothetical protein